MEANKTAADRAPVMAIDALDDAICFGKWSEAYMIKVSSSRGSRVLVSVARVCRWRATVTRKPDNSRELRTPMSCGSPRAEAVTRFSRRERALTGSHCDRLWNAVAVAMDSLSSAGAPGSEEAAMALPGLGGSGGAP